MLNGHGDDIYQYDDIRVNFSSNVYNHFNHEPLFAYLANKLDNVVSYPEPSPRTLEAELAMMMGLQAEEMCVCNGATEAIYLVAQTFRRSKSAVLMPTFSEYADACRLHEHDVCSFYSLEQIPERAQLIWICNPNNPTGTVIERDALLELINRNDDRMFVIDQSYAPFTLSPLITPAEAALFPNVIMLHSMTKEYAIPGLRLGYITAHKAVLHNLRLQRMPWSVNQVAIDAGRYLLAHQDDYRLDLTALLEERDRVAEQLQRLGCIDVWRSDTHILLCKLRMGKASALKDYLAREHHILIRDASNFQGLDSTFFRIAVQTSEENNLLIDAIAQWLME